MAISLRMSTTTNDPMKELWLARLGSALRTTLACSIVGMATLFGPKHLSHFLTYPAFSYVTTILIVSDATLGDAIRGCFLAVYATVQVMIPSVLALHMLGPDRFGPVLAALAVALTAFFVAVPESTPVLAKRIAFGQAVIVYVGTVVNGDRTGVVMHPVHVALSTSLGAFASVLAMLVPYPKLAHNELRKARGSYIENASRRLNLLVQAFTAQDHQTAHDLVSRSKFLLKTGIRHLQTIKQFQEGITWEKPHLRFMRPNCIDKGQDLGEIEVPMRGMEMALSSCNSVPIGIIDGGLREVLLGMKTKIGLKLEQAKRFAPFDARIAPDAKGGVSDEESVRNLKSTATNQDELPAYFFLYCMKLLLGKSPTGQVSSDKGIEQKSIKNPDPDEQMSGFRKTWNALIVKATEERWIFAIKCSVSLGFAVLFGLMYNRENGYWSGLTIAISFVTGRQATFTVANARAQGTAMGSVYGILCCYVFQRLGDMKFVTLLPWIVFTSFLRHSRMYGQAGGISAVIGALLILGRHHYGPPHEFAIARLTEACIGLICFIAVEIILQPARAATLARAELARTLEMLQHCIGNVVIPLGQEGSPSPTTFALREHQKKMKSRIRALENFVSEAEQEPNFWFLPFQAARYRTLLESLSKVADLLLFASLDIETVSREHNRLKTHCKELENVNNDLELIQESLGNRLRCLVKVLQAKSIAELEIELQNVDDDSSCDPELGKSQDQKDGIEMVSSLIRHSNEAATKINSCENEQKKKKEINEAVLCWSGLGFCISSAVKETEEIEKVVKEIITWENPTMRIDMYKLFSRINYMGK